MKKTISLIIYCLFWLGRIEFDEFVEVVADSYFKKFSRAEILEAFRRFDHNRDGYIEPDELKSILAKLGRHFSNEEVNHPFPYYMHEWIIDYLFRFVVWSLKSIRMETGKYLLKVCYSFLLLLNHILFLLRRICCTCWTRILIYILLASLMQRNWLFFSLSHPVFCFCSFIYVVFTYVHLYNFFLFDWLIIQSSRFFFSCRFIYINRIQNREKEICKRKS